MYITFKFIVYYSSTIVHVNSSVSVVIGLNKICMDFILKALSTAMHENRKKVFIVITQLKLREYSKDTHFSLNNYIHVVYISTFRPSLTSCILNLAYRQLKWCQNNTPTWLKCSRALHRTIAFEKWNRLGRNISLGEINLLRSGVIIAFNLLKIRDISLLCMWYIAKWKKRHRIKQSTSILVDNPDFLPEIMTPTSNLYNNKNNNNNVYIHQE